MGQILSSSPQSNNSTDAYYHKFNENTQLSEIL